MIPGDSVRLDRRTAIKWMLAAAAGTALWEGRAQGTASLAAGQGYGLDPDLTVTYRPGDLWPLTFTPAQRRTAAVLCDIIIPADGSSPSAAVLGIHDFIDEWISAPYPAHRDDREVVMEGLAWLDAESGRRFGKAFAETDPAQAGDICDDLCHEPEAPPECKAAAAFFDRFRGLTAGGFYTTPQGMKDLRYLGNLPLAAFPEPPAELLRKLGLD